MRWNLEFFVNIKFGSNLFETLEIYIFLLGYLIFDSIPILCM